jgi:hypothetical protein
MLLTELDDNVKQVLFDAYCKSARTQQNNNRKFQLTFDQYFTVVCQHKHALSRIIRRYQTYHFSCRRHPFRIGYVLSWKSYSDFQTGIMDMNTSCFVSEEESKLRCKMKKGDRHSDAAKQKIGAGQKGKPKSELHKLKISITMKKFIPTEESKAKRLATWAKKRALKEAANAGL